MRQVFLVCFCLCVANTTGAQTPAQAQVAKAIQAGFDAMNRGDANAFTNVYDRSAIIVDDTPPFVWSAPNALKGWQASDAKWVKENRVSSVNCSLRKTVRNEVVGDRAYFIGNGGCTVVMKGVRNLQDGTWTFVMVKRPQGWRAAMVAFAGTTLAPR
jgi:ketosteroid isomerase-like protein